MSASAEVCKTQVKRFEGLSFYPREGPGLKELIRTLMERSQNDDHARRIATQALNTLTECPKPAELIEIARETYSDEESGMPEHGCPDCHGRPWVHVFEDSRGAFADRCQCPMGKFLRAKDLERKNGGKAA